MKEQAPINPMVSEAQQIADAIPSILEWERQYWANVQRQLDLVDARRGEDRPMEEVYEG